MLITVGNVNPFKITMKRSESPTSACIFIYRSFWKESSSGQ